MRPPRIIIAVAFFLSTVFLTFLTLRSSHQRQTVTTSSPATSKTGIQSFFAFRAPFSLFPPNAVITLTHDNTTAFLARPAGFGPLLPSRGLKGQVWIGSGFGDDTIRQGTIAASAEGELGCSDVPGWSDGYAKSSAATSEGGKLTNGRAATSAGKLKPQKRGTDGHGPFDDGTTQQETSGAKRVPKKPHVDDGTDDYLHHPLPESTFTKPSEKPRADSKGDHADIQSIQEGAEISGKIVLLSRGGCGFLEKVKWAQRRGAIALMVGDDVQGGPLIQMYARGDTSNVTIPSIFTSRTTAHLLSSLIGPGSFIEDVVDKNGKGSLKLQATDKPKKGGNKQGLHQTFTPTAGVVKSTSAPRPISKASTKKVKSVAPTPNMSSEKPGWFKSMIFGSGKKSAKSELSRPPASGRLDWILVDEWKDDDEPTTKKISTKPKVAGNTKATGDNKPATKPSGDDDFQIGVQDWRDPDLVAKPVKEVDLAGKPSVAKAEGNTKAAFQNGAPVTTTGRKKHTGVAVQEPGSLPPLRGGSITPGSGEYVGKLPGATEKEQKDPASQGGSTGLLTTIFGADEENVEILPNKNAQVELTGKEERDGDDEQEGLWVTLTPTSGASPFLDTLLVLVVSPLVTLTVVYALLLIRSRIRRRRWRAPKSVVERLPVRTYQTLVPSRSPSPRTPNSPSPNNSTATTPLLVTSPQTRPRPRSRTTSGLPEPGDSMRTSNPLQVPVKPARAPEHEKNASESSEWRKHMGRQVECVVCLEEYVAGVSRVMSLPCGHEFHVDCITPWLTTRRRTCPICKGDVVRSLARGSPSNPRYEPYHDDSDEDIQAQAAGSVNTSSSAALPVGRSYDIRSDVEQGIASPTPTRPRRNQQSSGSWRALLSSSLGSSSRSPQPQVEDRNR
ncbi:related to PA and RING finger domain protein [Rhynchosporium secalis]|uniref:Related to PA and RING finger domain protein n=1 Tax=Rhynchosporium secalis TaxID=38038 RepID=A0A1E1MC02_RHYSE|nr:related to PA and RING finger domain protein [Rhynchosporium secalis]